MNIYNTDSKAMVHTKRWSLYRQKGEVLTREELLQTAKPILFNTEMVRAILEDRKTVTRRVVKPQPTKDMIHKLGFCVDGDAKDIGKFGFGSSVCGGNILYVKQPYEVDQILYVRETWGCYTKNFADAAYFMYKANFPDGATKYMNAGVECDMPKWKPSIHMPKDAARIFLKVKSVRVERLQEMDRMDAVKEGTDNRLCVNLAHALTKLKKLWNSTIKKADIDTYGWDANPYVWVIEFERIQPEKEV